MRPIPLGLAGLVVVSLLAVVPAAARADTKVFPGTGHGAAAHRIRDVVVDNTGPRIGVTVRTAGAKWVGRVTLRLDFAGGAGADATATVPHGHRARIGLRTSGRSWRCKGLTLSSPPRSRVTRLSLPRTCAAMATKLGATVVVDPRRGPTYRQRTTIVPQQGRPNVLMFVTDDMRADDLPYMPKLQRWLGDGGTTWTNSLAPYPLCCPARSSIFTGEYTHNHRVFSHKPPYGFHAFDDRATLATWLQDAGYHTALLGKYLNGYGGQPLRGEETGTSVRYHPPGWDDWQAALDGGLPADSPVSGGAYRYYSTTLSKNQGRGLVRLNGYQTYAYGGIERDVVRNAAASDDPFFSYVAFTAPHIGQPRDPDDPADVVRDDGRSVRMASPAVPGPLRGHFDTTITQAPGADWLDPDPSDKAEELQSGQLFPPNEAEKAAMLEVTRQRAESLAAVDTTIDSILTTLRATGELQQTYVVFTSDNGYFLGEQGIREGKILPYEAALRTPLLMRGPGIPAGQVRTDPFTSIDFAPTILQMAGVPIPDSVDGAGLLRVAENGDRGWARPVLVNTGPASIVRETDESGLPIDPDDPGAADQRYLLGVRTGRYLFTDRASGFQELYDLAVDPEQYVNLVDDPAYATVLTELRDELQRIRGCKGAGCRTPLPADLRTPAP